MNHFNEPSAIQMIKPQIIEERQLEEKIAMIQKDCNWETKRGKFVDTFWIASKDRKQNSFGYIYEYYLDCDSLRFIFWYPDANQSGDLIDLMIEPLEEESLFVINKSQSLNKN